MPATYSSNPFLNILFAISYGLCTYFYSISMIEDPGYVPKLGSRAQQKAVVEELLSLWKFDEQNFCVQCLIRMPVRSKHCKRCKRCVAKEDQWVQHQQEMITGLRELVIVHGYIIALERITIVIFSYT